MSARHALILRYHPAKKEVTFSRTYGKTETPISGDSGSILSKYINQKGQFVLQDHGNQFFNDIIESFDGEKEVNVDAIMTETDYEDFQQMVEYFNKGSDVKINPTLIATLPDMNATYDAVKKHGLDSIAILNKNRSSFFHVKSDNPNVKQCIENFAKEINDATKGISDKIETLDQNTVNVCFSGPYSSGKSLLINSLIGSAILPTDIRPETAAMFVISSPKPGKSISIVFNILDADESYSEVIWDQDSSMFIFATGQPENQTRKKVQETINSCKEKQLFEQVHDLLDVLNADAHVDRTIEVHYPVAVDNDKVQFTIYDTPGTDSGVSEHKYILKDALSEQTHSILVFVTYPNGLNAGGNRALLEYLAEIEQKKDRSTIDLGRSLFVINFSDMLKSEEQFDALRSGAISNKEESKNKNGSDANKQKIITIKLSDKKVFFTSAMYGYTAAAIKKGIASKSEERLLRLDSGKLLDEEFGQYYQHDRCASSEYATQLLINNSKREFNLAKSKDNFAEEAWVASGLYALESEIRQYGEKYASAVKAYSIIDGVDKALAKLNKNAQSIERQNKEDIKEVDDEILSIRNAVASGIEKAKRGKEIGKNEAIPRGIVKELHLDTDSISTYVQSKADEKVDKILLNVLQKIGKKFANKLGKEFNLSEISWDERKESGIEVAVQEVLDHYTEYYKTTRKKLLEQMRDTFKEEVCESISKNGELSDEAKAYICDIDLPEVEEFDDSNKLGELYRKNKMVKHVFWTYQDRFDRKKFLSQMNMYLAEFTGKLADSYKEDYRQSLNGMLERVESEFNLNLDKYSVTLKAKLEDKDAMEELKDKIVKAVDELHDCQDRLNKVIWEVK